MQNTGATRSASFDEDGVDGIDVSQRRPRSELLREAELAFAEALRADLFPQRGQEYVQQDDGHSISFEDALVAELEALLVRVRAGEIVGLAAALQCSDGGGESLIVGQTNPLPLVGALEAVKFSLLHDHLKREE